MNRHNMPTRSRFPFPFLSFPVWGFLSLILCEPSIPLAFKALEIRHAVRSVKKHDMNSRMLDSFQWCCLLRISIDSAAGICIQFFHSYWIPDLSILFNSVVPKCMRRSCLINQYFRCLISPSFEDRGPILQPFSNSTLPNSYSLEHALVAALLFNALHTPLP